MRIQKITAVVLLLTLSLVGIDTQTALCAEENFEPSLYYPDGLFVWDTWFLQDGDTTHVFHLQVKRPPKNVDENFKQQKERIENYAYETDKATFEGTVGHATSKNLLAWTEQSTALFKTDAAKVGGRENAYDDGTQFTGCAIKHEGVYYLFYTANTRRRVEGQKRGMQTICLATSTDGIHYKKHPKNPLFAPDPNRYYTYPDPPAPFKHHARRGTDCRDILVVKDPAGKGWLGYVVMRRKGFNDAFHSACIVLCRSDNLVDWEVGEPVCTPNRFNCFEVPDVFKIGPKWYMIAMTGDIYGQSDRWADKDISLAIIVFEADSAYGPFLEVRDNLLLSSCLKNGQGASARTVERNGERLLFYTHSEVSTGRGRLNWPEKLIPRAEGGLDTMYWHGVDKAFEGAVDAAARNVTSDGSGTKLVKVREWPAKDSTYMIRARVDLHTARATGIALGRKDGSEPFVLAGIDCGAGPEGLVSIELGGEKKIIQKRERKIAKRGVYDLRVIVCGEIIKFYVDERLVLTQYAAGIKPGDVHLYARGGEARCQKLKYYAGKKNTPAGTDEGFVWKSEIPADCPFDRSPTLGGIRFTGRHSDYTCGDTWYPSWASDGNLYSPWTDGRTEGMGCSSAGDVDARTAHAVMIGDDPMNLTIRNTSKVKVAGAKPYLGRYPAGSLVYNGIWYYATYCLGPDGGYNHRGFKWNWPNLGPMPGFQISRDLGKTWTPSPLSPSKPLFPEPEKHLGPVKMGAPHFVDFGKNMEHSPDGKAYMLGMGALKDDPMPRPCLKVGKPGEPFETQPCTEDFAHANLSWISADQIYLARVTPSPETINDVKAWEFFAGHDKKANPVWTNDFEKIKPLIEWNNNMGCVTATYVPALKKYLMCVTDGWPTVAKMDSYILEADKLTGPWRMAVYMKDFGEQAYFLNFPSKFISDDGRTLWLCYSANFSSGWNGMKLGFNPPGGRYGLSLHEVKLLGAENR